MLNETKLNKADTGELAKGAAPQFRADGSVRPSLYATLPAGSPHGLFIVAQFLFNETLRPL
jgi:hypothetical protein